MQNNIFLQQILFTRMTHTLKIKDPRNPRANVEMIAFYYPGYQAPCDILCGKPFLGNFWETGYNSVSLTSPSHATSCNFRNAEAAFQALKFWNRAQEFGELNGPDSFRLKRNLSGDEDYTYSGYGNNVEAMKIVLWQKFAIPTMTQKLIATGDTFLLEHNDMEGRDAIWSDNYVGNGKNLLGMLLMLIRDNITGRDSWTTFINTHFDFTSHSVSPVWQDCVSQASATVREAIDIHLPQCSLPGCSKPTWNGEINGYCSKAHRNQALNICAKPGCSKQTWNGEINGYCSKAHRNQALNICAKPGCSKQTWNGMPGNYCSRRHMNEAL